MSEESTDQATFGTFSPIQKIFFRRRQRTDSPRDRHSHSLPRTSREEWLPRRRIPGRRRGEALLRTAVGNTCTFVSVSLG